MNRKLLFTLVLAVTFFTHDTTAQVTDSSAQWAWMGGSKATLQAGTYGAPNSFLASNQPGARIRPACWKDRQGKFWMFGGQGYGTSASGDLNDLWMYDSVVKQWAFIGGSTSINANGVYGLRGVAALSNWPGGRRTMSYWTDTAGNFWMFGGMGLGKTGSEGYLDDLWKYDPVARSWTWISGDTVVNVPGVYGTKKTTLPSNKPGGRGNGFCATWVDSANNFWIYGSYGYAKTSTLGRLNDLWKFDPVANAWTWISGDDVIDQLAVYSPAGSVKPGALAHVASWADNKGNLWMFGGLGFDGASTFNGPMNGMWKYNMAADQWTLVMGSTSSTPSANLGVYGTKGAAAPGNIPGGRYSPGCWKDAQGNVWIFGGYGYATGTSQQYLNDLWKYDPVANQWTWMKGTNVIANGKYGSLKTQDPLNAPGGRGGPAIWVDNTNNVWMFGGIAYGESGSYQVINDLWRLSPPPCSVNITASRPLTLCQGDSVILKANSIATGIAYQWYEGVTQVGTDTAYVAKTPGSYTVKISSSTCNNISQPSVVTVNPLPAVSINLSPATAVICMGKDTALTASGGVSYAWAPPTGLNTTTGATVRANPTTTTTYTVQGTGANGCIGVASRIVTVNQLPAITISPAVAVICNGNDTALTAGGGISYTWLPNTYSGSGTTIRANPTNTTTYTVTGTDANGCVNTATRAVTVNALPNITITPATAIICAGRDTALTGNGGVAYSWLPATGLSAPSSATTRATPGGTTTYTVTGMDLNGCKNTATRTVTVNNNPTVVINPSTAAICNGSDTGFAAGGATTYNWTPALGLNITNTAAVRANPTTTTSYIVTGTDINGCIGKDTQTVVVKNLPAAIVTPGGPVGFCERDSILLTASYTPGANSTYQWKNGIANVGNGTEKHMANVAGNYTVTIKDTASCSATSTIVVVSMNTRPLVNLTISGPTEFCEGNAVMLSIPYDTGINYQWTRDNANVPYAGVSFYQALESGVYKVIASRTNIANCADTSQDIPVIVHPLPNPALYANGARLYTDNKYVSYQWFYMGQALLGQTSWEYTAIQEGTYQVLVIDSNNCSNESVNRTMVNLGFGKIGPLTDAITLYPNPAQERINISSPVDVSIQLYNMAGQQLLYTEHVRSVDVSALASGLYMVRVLDSEGALIKVEKIIKQ